MNYDDAIINPTLNLILLLDRSSSMINERIAQVNHAIPVLKTKLMNVAADENVNIKLRIIAFNDAIEWTVGKPEEGADIADVVWTDLSVAGSTVTPKAIAAANEALKVNFLGKHALKPVVILVTDGFCNVHEHDKYLAEIEKMKKKLAANSGKEKVTRIAIGVGGYRREELEEFASTGYIDDVLQPLVFEVDKASDLSAVINWVSVSSVYTSITGGEDYPDLGETEEWYEPEDSDDII